MTRSTRGALTGALALTSALSAPARGDTSLDEERAAWRYRREVAVSGISPGARGPAFAALPLPPEVLGRSQDDLQDLRLLRPAQEGHPEVPYVVDRQAGRTVLTRTAGALRDTRRERERTVLLIDLGAPRSFDTVELDIPAKDFARRVTLEGAVAAASGPFTTLRSDAGLFDQTFTPSRGADPARVHHTLIALDQPAVARYLRLTIIDLRWPRFPHIEVAGVSVQRRRLLAAERWSRALSLRPLPAAPRRGRGPRGPSRYLLELPPGLAATTPIGSLELEADDPSFRRTVTLWAEPTAASGPPVPGAPPRQRLGEALVYRLPATNDSEVGALPQSEQRLLLPTDRASAAVGSRSSGGALVLEVDDGDSPPLRGLRAVATGVAARLVLPLIGLSDRERLLLYYGNGRTRAPRYDLEDLKARPPQRLALAALGDEAENPRHRPPPPLAAVASLGAELSSERWRFLRALQVPAEGLYRAELHPTDLALLQPDLRDLRIVTAGAETDRQVPYVLSRPELPRALPLQVVKEAGRPRVSRYALSPPSAAPLWALELSVRERFFDRSVRVLADRAPGSAPGAGLAAPRVLHQGPLQRGAADDTGETQPPPLRLPLGGEALARLYLEIDEGDNAPLTVESVQGESLVPRLAFKAPPGSYRLLLGNAEAEAPRYDLAVLRSEVLSYDADPLALAERVANPAFRRRPADLVRGDGGEGRATLLLWGAIGAAVLVLLALTLKLAVPPPRQSDAPPKP